MPEDHCALNVVLTGPYANSWAMTERSGAALRRDVHHLSIGPSSLSWDGDALVIRIDERCSPLPLPLQGVVCVRPDWVGETGFHLDPQGKHRWHPIAPRARVQVALAHPGLSWRGDGYLDSNFGEEPLEAGFRDWHWSRAHLRRDVAVLYEGTRADGEPFELALRMDRQGRWEDMPLPPRRTLPRSFWQLERLTRADADAWPQVQRTWVDAPFYARSKLSTRLYGEDACAVHESLSLPRFCAPSVQWMLPFKMPRHA